MRTVLLVVVTLLLIGGGFFAVTVLLPDPDLDPGAKKSSIEVEPPIRIKGELTATGEGTTYKRFSGNRLVQEFHADKFEPTSENQVRVEKPRLKFFLGDGRIVVVAARVGTLETAGKIDLQGEAAAPKQGVMRDVLITMLEPGNDDPILTAHVDNLRFDAETMELATADSTIDGRPMLGEQVPVTVRGRDYDFDGRGLLVRWNDADGRLELLRIHRGERLILKDPELLRQLESNTTAAADPDPQQMYAAARDVPVDPAKTFFVYEASFREDVSVTQGNEQLVDADRLTALFAMEQIDTATATDQEPAKTGTSGKPEAGTSPTLTTTDQPTPVVLTWQGEFVVLPASEARATMLNSAEDWRAMLTGKAAGKATGTPVTVQRNGMKIRAAALEYGALTDSLVATAAAEDSPIEVTGEDGLRLETRGIEFDGASNTARLTGPSWAMIPMKNDAGEDDILKAEWQQRCRIGLDRGETGQLAVRSIDLAGDVEVDHPQSHLTSQRLTMNFAAPRPAPQTDANRPADVSQQGGLGDAMAGLGALESVVAEEDVIAVLRSANPDEPNREIRARTLTLLTAPDANGDPELKTIEADGDVRIADATGTLNADAVVADLAVQPDGTADITSIEARDNVRLEQDNVIATAAVLQGRGVGPDAMYRLAGPEVILQRGDDVFTCKTVMYQPATGAAEIPDGGMLRTLFTPDDGGQAMPVRAMFEGTATLRPDADRIDVEGPLKIEADAEDGSLVTAVGDRLEMTLDPSGTGEKPKVRSATLLGNIDLNKVLRAEDGRVVQRVHLLTERLDFDTATQVVTIPVAGRMLYEDFTPQAEAPAHPDNPNKSGLQQRFGEFRGSAGLQWADQLVYQRGNGDLKILGNVQIVAKPTSESDQERYRVRANRIDAKLNEVGKTVEVKTAAVSGDVDFAAPDLKFIGGIARYDADNGVMVVTGTKGQPVELLQNDGTSRGTFTEVIYDTAAGQIISSKGLQGRVIGR